MPKWTKEENEAYVRDTLRKFQNQHGHRISPRASVFISNGYDLAKSKDETWLQARRWVDDLMEKVR